MSRNLFICLFLALLFTVPGFGAPPVKKEDPKDINAEIQEYIRKYGYVNKSSSTIMPDTQPQVKDEVTEEEESKMSFPEKIKLNVNRLGSTNVINAQAVGKSKLLGFSNKAVPYLTDHLLKDKRTYVRIQIADILGTIKDEMAIPTLELTSRSRYPALTKACISAIGNIGGKFAVESLSRLEGQVVDLEILGQISEAKEKASKKVNK